MRIPGLGSWRFILLAALLCVALLDARVDTRRHALTVIWHPTRKLGVDAGVRAVQQGIDWLWRKTPGELGPRIRPVTVRTKKGGETSRRAVGQKEESIERHTERDRRALERAASGP